MDATASATEMNTTFFPPQILPDRAVVKVAGDGALAFLHNLLTADLSVAKHAYGALLTPQGKILNDVFILADDDKVWIDVASVHAADFLKRLLLYKLRAKLEMTLQPDRRIAVSMTEMPGLAFIDPRHAGLGYRAIVESSAVQDATSYHAVRIQRGIADSVADIGSCELFVHEANLDQLHGVSFTKGCYVGQEVVSRVHHKHSARNRVLPVSFHGDAQHGSDILSGGTRVGSMLSSHGGRGLALLRLDRLAEATAPLMTGSVKLTVHKPDWATFDLTIPEALQ
jgi:tRNA-modifying protein YgfZ